MLRRIQELQFLPVQKPAPPPVGFIYNQISSYRCPWH